MTVSEFEASLSEDNPPAISAPLEAMWRLKKGDWEGAHMLVQDDPSKEAAWVHAHLHRIEGDMANAAYWYRKARKNRIDASIDAEWGVIVGELL